MHNHLVLLIDGYEEHSSSFFFIAVTTPSCALTASALISIFLDPWRNEMPLQATCHDHFNSPLRSLATFYLDEINTVIYPMKAAKVSNQIKFINIRQQIIKSTHVKRNKMNNVRLLKGECDDPTTCRITELHFCIFVCVPVTYLLTYLNSWLVYFWEPFLELPWPRPRCIY